MKVIMQTTALVCATVSLALSASSAPVPLALAEPGYATFIAHRGESFDAPENTLPAYKMAVDRGFGFECDVYLSSDKQVFSFHDSNLKRTTGRDLPCNKASWADVVSKLDAGAWKGPQWKGTRPALLEEILALARDGRYIYVEIKSGPEIVPYVKEIFAKQKNATPKNALFICFNKKVCKELKTRMPEYKVYWLSSSKTGKGKDAKPVTSEYLLSSLKETGADGLDVHFNPEIITADLAKAIKEAGYEFHVWTVDKLATSLQAFAIGAQTVTTNCAKKQLDEFNASQNKK